MQGRRHIVHNEPFINYAYQRLKNSTKEERERLTPAELKNFKDDKTLNRFCKHETKEKLDYLLTKMGVEWVQVYADNLDDGCSAVVNCWDQFSFPQKRSDIVRAMVDGNVFATGSREQMMSLHMAAQNSATKAYSVSQYAKELVEKGRGFNKMKTYAEEMDEAKLAYEEFTRLALVLLNSQGWIKENMNLHQEELRILCVLFHNRNTAIPYYQLLDGIEMSGKYVYIGRFVVSLVEKGYVSSDCKENKTIAYKKKTFFMITGIGIEKMVKYVNYIHELTFGRKKRKDQKLY